MTIQSDENIANSYKTVQKRTVSRTEYQRNTTKQIELCEFEYTEMFFQTVIMIEGE